MRIRPSARRHGINDADIRHAVDNALATGPTETYVGVLVGVLHIGPDRRGTMLEVITICDIDGSEVAIHAMKLRKTYEQHLRDGGQT